MKKQNLSILLSITLFFILNSTLYSQYRSLEDTVKIVRDEFGVPHIISENEPALFFGAGYVAAEDRLFQMVLARRAVQGRLSEILGNRYFESDKKMRLLGLYNHAKNTLPQLSFDVQKWLKAYADGVNAYMKDNPHLSELFENYGGTPEEWKPEDCIACQMRIAERFDGGWQNEISRLREFETLESQVGRDSAIKYYEQNEKNVDDFSAIVSKDEYEKYSEKLSNLRTNIKENKKPNVKIQKDWESPKMSHNWVVSGSRTKSGKPILESDPQIAVESPATWYEFHLKGGRFNVRGISVPGTPSMLIGFNENCAWGLTALGGDCVDLFQEKLNTDSSQCEWNGGWADIQKRKEIIKVKGTRDTEILVLETQHGTIVNDLLKNLNQNEFFALHYQVTQGPDFTIEALLDMMSAKNWNEFTAGMSKYKSPAAHLIYADKFDNIAYYTLSAVPLRVHNAGIPFRGWTGDEEWLGRIPFDSMPRMLNPDAGFISTANNLPIGSWYKYFVGGAIGDNSRSLRLKELLIDGNNLTVEDFFNIHRDAVEPIARDFVKYGIMAVDEVNPDNENAKKLANLLRDWDYKMLTSFHSYLVVSQISTIIKRSIRGTPLEEMYLGSDAGLIQIFRDLDDYFESNSTLIPDTSIRNWLVAQMGEVWIKSNAEQNANKSVRLTHLMKYQNNLEGYGSLDTDYDLTSPSLYCGVVPTIWSQLGNSYSQIVNFENIDSSFSILPPGNSEIPENNHFSDLMDLWAEGEMHIAPLSLEEIISIQESEKLLYPATNSVEDINKSEITIYPNPASEYIEIYFDKLSESSKLSKSCQIKIYNILGECVLSVGANGRSPLQRIAVSGLPDGIYSVVIQNNQVIETVKFVVIK